MRVNQENKCFIGRQWKLYFLIKCLSSAMLTSINCATSFFKSIPHFQTRLCKLFKNVIRASGGDLIYVMMLLKINFAKNWCLYNPKLILDHLFDKFFWFKMKIVIFWPRDLFTYFFVVYWFPKVEGKYWLTWADLEQMFFLINQEVTHSILLVTGLVLSQWMKCTYHAGIHGPHSFHISILKLPYATYCNISN